MKSWFVIFALALWLQLPSEGDAKHLAPALRELSPNKLADMAKRHQTAQEKRGASSEEMNQEIADILASEGLATTLSAMGISMTMIDELVDNDKEIEPEHKDLMKFLLIMSLLGIDLDDLGLKDGHVFTRAFNKFERKAMRLLKQRNFH